MGELLGFHALGGFPGFGALKTKLRLNLDLRFRSHFIPRALIEPLMKYRILVNAKFQHLYLTRHKRPSAALQTAQKPHFLPPKLYSLKPTAYTVNPKP